jgi:hypothetical protein
MERLKLGRSQVFEVLGTRELQSIKVGRRRLVSESALADYIRRLEQQYDAPVNGGSDDPTEKSESPPRAPRRKTQAHTTTPERKRHVR